MPPSATHSISSKRRENVLNTVNKTWDPRDDLDPVPHLIIAQIYLLLLTERVSAFEDTEVLVEDKSMGDTTFSRTKLDSHENMHVVGKHYFIVSDTGKTADVSAFSTNYEKRQIKLVNTVLQYECIYLGMSYIIVIRNALHVTSMANNLILTFMMKEAHIIVHITPKIQVDYPVVDDHSIFFPDTNFQIPL